MTASKDEVVNGLKKVWDAFHFMEHELYADYIYDALEFIEKQEEIIRRYNAADTFLCSHGWTWDISKK